jgi:hypothetical protein
LRKNRARRILALLCVFAGFIALFVVAAVDHSRANGEPLLLFEGISAWPTDFLRLFAGVLAIWYCITTRWRVTADIKDLGKKYFTQEAGTSAGQAFCLLPPKDEGWGWRLVGRLWRLGRLGRFIKHAWKAAQRLIILCWRIPGPAGSLEPMSLLWDEYENRRSRLRCSLRVAGIFILYMIATVLLFSFVSPPVLPVRGEVSRHVDGVGILLGYMSVAILLFLVLDATRVCDRFIRLLFSEEHNVFWPDDARGPVVREFDLSGEDVDGWLSIKLIARHTEVVDKTIYYPFIALFILLVSRHPVFDNWTWNIPLIVVFTFLAFVAVWAACRLRNSAKRARRIALGRLGKKISEARADRDGRRAGQLGMVVDEIKGVQTGAFSHVWDNPVIRAVLIPSGGVGTLAVIDLVVRHL